MGNEITKRWIKIQVSKKQYLKKQTFTYDISLISMSLFNYRLVIKMLTVHNASINLSTVGLKVLDLLLTSGNVHTHIFLMLPYILKILKHLLDVFQCLLKV